MFRPGRVLWAFGLAGLFALAPSTGVARAQEDAPPPRRPKLSPWVANAVYTLQKERSAKRRLEAIRALTRANNPQLVPVLAHYAAYDADESVREAAAHTIARYRTSSKRWEAPPYPRPRLRDLLDPEYADDERKVREARDAIEELRTSRRSYRREDAARDLGRIGGPGVVPILAHTAAYDPDSTVRHVADRSIERIRRRADRWRPPELPGDWVQESRPEGYDPGDYYDPDRPPPRPDPTAELIESAVVHYLRRGVEPQEMRDWLSHFRRGGTYEDMLATFLGAEGYFEMAGSEPVRYIVRLYNDVLRRQPSRDEVRVWLDHWRRLRGNFKEVAKLFVQASRNERQQRNIPY